MVTASALELSSVRARLADDRGKVRRVVVVVVVMQVGREGGHRWSLVGCQEETVRQRALGYN
jgi:hypothetical protein